MFNFKQSDYSVYMLIAGADPGFDQGGGAQIVTGLKLPFWGLSFVEFWCWGLIFSGQGGGPGPRAPPLDPPLDSTNATPWIGFLLSFF